MFVQVLSLCIPTLGMLCMTGCMAPSRSMHTFAAPNSLQIGYCTRFYNFLLNLRNRFLHPPLLNRPAADVPFRSRAPASDSNTRLVTYSLRDTLHIPEPLYIRVPSDSDIEHTMWALARKVIGLSVEVEQLQKSIEHHVKNEYKYRRHLCETFNSVQESLTSYSYFKYYVEQLCRDRHTTFVPDNYAFFNLYQNNYKHALTYVKNIEISDPDVRTFRCKVKLCFEDSSTGVSLSLDNVLGQLSSMRRQITCLRNSLLYSEAEKYLSYEFHLRSLNNLSPLYALSEYEAEPDAEPTPDVPSIQDPARSQEEQHYDLVRTYYHTLYRYWTLLQPEFLQEFFMNVNSRSFFDISKINHIIYSLLREADSLDQSETGSILEYLETTLDETPLDAVDPSRTGVIKKLKQLKKELEQTYRVLNPQ